jgi:hypothetical protein
MAFEIKQNDRRPRWRVQLTANGAPVNITGATGAVFTMMAGTSGTPKVNKAAMTIIDAPTGVVEYAWASGDTSTTGEFNVEVEVNWGGGETQTFPSVGYFTITIEDDLA